MKEGEQACIFCGEEAGEGLEKNNHSKLINTWRHQCVTSVCCLFGISDDQADNLHKVLTDSNYCGKCSQLIRDMDFTLRQFNNLLQQLEKLQTNVLDRMSNYSDKLRKNYDYVWVKDGEESNVEMVHKLFREKRGEVVVGIVWIKEMMGLSRLTEKKTSPNSEEEEGPQPPRALRSLNRKRKPSLEDDDINIQRKVDQDNLIKLEPGWSDDDWNAFSDTEVVMDNYEVDDVASDAVLSDQEFPTDTDSDEYVIKPKRSPRKPRRNRSQLKRNPVTSKPLKCSQCERRFSSQLILDVHFRKVHDYDPTPYHCARCPKKFTNRHNWTSHNCPRKRPPGPQTYGQGSHLCEFCSKKFSTDNYLKKHKAKFHTQHYCDFCHFGLETLEEAKTHEQLHLKNEVHAFQCVLCPAILVNSIQLKKHVTSSHTNREVTCDVCGLKFMALRTMKTHRKIHDADYVGHKCDICGHIFQAKSSLTTHMFKHNATKSFICEICGNSFTFPKGLKAHLASHQDKGKFPCKVCGKRFYTKSFLARHEAIHSGTFTFVCETCGKKFKTRGNLMQHCKTHLGTGVTKKRIRRKKEEVGNQEVAGLVNDPHDFSNYYT